MCPRKNVLPVYTKAIKEIICCNCVTTVTTLLKTTETKISVINYSGFLFNMKERANGKRLKMFSQNMINEN